MAAKHIHEDRDTWHARPPRRRERHVWPARSKDALRRERRWWRRALLEG